jgi:hypothetical protein
MSACPGPGVRLADADRDRPVLVRLYLPTEASAPVPLLLFSAR